jgi:hypothetical protein
MISNKIVPFMRRAGSCLQDLDTERKKAKVWPSQHCVSLQTTKTAKRKEMMSALHVWASSQPYPVAPFTLLQLACVAQSEKPFIENLPCNCGSVQQENTNDLT